MPEFKNQARSTQDIQKFLTAQGYDIPVTGVWDQATEDAVQSFQTSQGLVVDGKWGRDTEGVAATIPTTKFQKIRQSISNTLSPGAQDLTSFHNSTYFLSEDDSPIKIDWTDKGQSNASALKPGQFTNGKYARIGHAANLTIDENGNILLYEYGRYGAPNTSFEKTYWKDKQYQTAGNHGNVQITSLGNINALAKDGQVSEQDIMKYVASKGFHNGSLTWARTNQSAKETQDLWDELGSNPNRGCYSGIGNNCVSTAARMSGKVDRPAGAKAGEEGFWIPIQGQVLAQNNPLNTGNINGQFGINDVLARVWNKTPQLLQSAVTVGQSIINTGRDIYNKADERYNNAVKFQDRKQETDPSKTNYLSYIK